MPGVTEIAVTVEDVTTPSVRTQHLVPTSCWAGKSTDERNRPLIASADRSTSTSVDLEPIRDRWRTPRIGKCRRFKVWVRRMSVWIVP